MTFTALNFIYALIGIVAGVIINALADYLPSSSTPLWPQWRTWRWSERKRPYLVIGGTAVLFFLLPLWLTVPANLIFNSLYIAILILIIVTDLEHRLIFNKVIYAGTALALVGSFLLPATKITSSWRLWAASWVLLFFTPCTGLPTSCTARVLWPWVWAT